MIYVQFWWKYWNDLNFDLDLDLWLTFLAVIYWKDKLGDVYIHTNQIKLSDDLKMTSNDLDLIYDLDIWPVSYAYDFKGEYVSISEKITPIALIVPEILNLKVSMTLTLTLTFDFEI